MTKHLMYVPFTGLGLYGGHRGRRWLRNRIKIFDEFVITSLLSQKNQDFIVWVSWRHEDRNEPMVDGLKKTLEKWFPGRVVFTYSGVCFWDDKHPDDVAHDRLISAVHGAIPELLNVVGDADHILMTIQPSDDCYHRDAVDQIQSEFANDPTLQNFGYSRGYVMDYVNRRLCDWNPKTTPPFYTIKFPREIFMDPQKHLAYTGPYKSHEYVKDFLKSKYSQFRGFLVGTHGENISTIFKHPFAGYEYTDVDAKVHDFGIDGLDPLYLPISLRKRIMRSLPHYWHRKLRYWLGERFAAKIYDWLRA